MLGCLAVLCVDSVNGSIVSLTAIFIVLAAVLGILRVCRVLLVLWLSLLNQVLLVLHELSNLLQQPTHLHASGVFRSANCVADGCIVKLEETNVNIN